jgi:hypothetical protein
MADLMRHDVVQRQQDVWMIGVEQRRPCTAGAAVANRKDFVGETRRD